MASSSSSKAAIVEVREELMVSPADAIPTIRKAHFLKPSKDSIFSPSSEPQTLCLSSPPEKFEPENWDSKVKFCGWRNPQKNWKIWVQKMRSLHESTWKKAGIHEAILNSTFEIPRNNELVFGVAEKWCNETKSFVFSWGEATITLEDMVILGGYSVLGSPVFVSSETEESKQKEKKLNNVRAELSKPPSKKASQGSWIKIFMDSNDDIELEHEAFLVLWLSRFVFPSTNDSIVKRIFPIAVEIARGNRIALAPAVLASIYKDLSLLKEVIIASQDELGIVNLWSPLHLVQVWVMERFPLLRPQPNLLKIGEPRLARWHGLKVRMTDAKSMLERASFEWRPYTKGLLNWNLPKFYPEREMWVLDNSDLALDDEMLSFAQCLRVSMLVGLENIEQYFPHRVSLQFGMDQDVPDSVFAANDSPPPEIAWLEYNKLVEGLYVPSRFSEGNVTSRYLKWREKLVLNPQEQPSDSILSSRAKKLKKTNKGSAFIVSPIVVDSDSLTSSVRVLSMKSEEIGDSAASLARKELHNLSVPPGFPPKGKMVDAGLPIEDEIENQSQDSVDEDDDDDDHKTIAELLGLNKKSDKNVCEGPSNDSVDDHGSIAGDDNGSENDESFKEIMMLSVELEDRVSKLERTIERLKVAKCGRKSQ